ncbi:YibE/F family protein [Spirochaeta thermophila DSM 6578]|uniref:YibE/F family protein n=1 Tax=Winmispira thermophila (strain ATCC 700085 / DSM 6578 / Z-1203) TaxID=869211 RepID=G0GFB8_WINT7|nr:YibE/F family protein [Spirochaeta thermophila]AEJ61532.1 YibE/F family protein [Spirochaeta thermophila DSM 6578]
MTRVLHLLRSKDGLVTLSSVLCIGVLLLLPTTTRFDRPRPDEVRAKGLVVTTDDSNLHQFGLVRQGEQVLEVEVTSGPWKGERVRATNILQGSLELDKVFSPGDAVLVVLTVQDGVLSSWASVPDFWRLDVELILALAFSASLLVFAGWTGFRALVSFVLTAVSFWKLLLPAYLAGYAPVPVAVAVVSCLTGLILLLIGGWRRKTLVAFLGAVVGMGAILAVIGLWGGGFRLHGAVRQFAESLLYSGFPYLDLTGILYASIFMGAMGAIMDLAMDIASAQEELVRHRPDIGRMAIVRSGMRVGRAVLGTMSTTLLFAYSGSYLPLLLVFMAQGVPLLNALNLQYVAVEVLHTLAGSMGLVLVAPATAVMGGLLFPGVRDAAMIPSPLPALPHEIPQVEEEAEAEA